MSFILDRDTEYHFYSILHDILPILLAVPLAYLGFCFQRRSNFHASLRLLWTNIIDAVNKSLLYAEYKNESKLERMEILLALSKCIDEVRGVYTNVNETKSNKGYFPFESLKSIYTIVEELGKSNKSEEQMKEAGEKIKHHWQIIRKNFLAEFDRSVPTRSDTILD
jgi:hypothetical protein